MVTKAHIKANTKWEHNNIEKVTLRLKKDNRAKLKLLADKENKSLNRFIIDCINEHAKENIIE